MSATESLIALQRNYKYALSVGFSKEMAKRYAALIAAGTYKTIGQNIRVIK